MQNLVFVLDTNKQALSPCQPVTARKLLRDGKAAVYRRYPFTIILIGQSGQTVKLCPDQKPLRIKAVGRGSRQMVNSDKYGFPRGKAKQAKRVHGFQTGDMVKAIVPAGKKKGVHVGTVSIRTTGSFKVNGKVDGIGWKYCKRLHAQDGYAYGN